MKAQTVEIVDNQYFNFSVKQLIFLFLVLSRKHLLFKGLVIRKGKKPAEGWQAATRPGPRLALRCWALTSDTGGTLREMAP